MNVSEPRDNKKDHKSRKDMPWRVAPRLEGVVKNREVSRKSSKKGKR